MSFINISIDGCSQSKYRPIQLRRLFRLNFALWRWDPLTTTFKSGCDSHYHFLTLCWNVFQRRQRHFGLNLVFSYADFQETARIVQYIGVSQYAQLLDVQITFSLSIKEIEFSRKTKNAQAVRKEMSFSFKTYCKATFWALQSWQPFKFSDACLDS